MKDHHISRRAATPHIFQKVDAIGPLDEEIATELPGKMWEFPIFPHFKNPQKWPPHGSLLESLPSCVSWEVRMSRKSSKHRCHCKVLEQADMVLFHVITCMIEAERCEKVRKIFFKKHCIKHHELLGEAVSFS